MNRWKRWKTGRRRNLPVNDNMNETTELDGTMDIIMRGDSLQREIIEGRLEGKSGSGRSMQILLDWMMS